jgi:mono/diheme cytochrome c family protein
MFQVYCSSCHGRDAKGGSGPNLTTLVKRNDGKFPAVMVRETIRGETRVDAHGPKDIPAWGLEASAGLGIVGGGIYDASLRTAQSKPKRRRTIAGTGGTMLNAGRK